MTGDNGKITDLNVARFHRSMDPADHDPLTALDAAREWIEECEEKPDHVIVLVGRTVKDGGSSCRFFQAGKYTYHAQYGLVHEGAAMIREDG